jgi:hypothetical protein
VRRWATLLPIFQPLHDASADNTARRQRAFFEGKQTTSNREGFLYWMGAALFGVKWRNFKMVLILQKTLSDPALHLTTTHLINLENPSSR